MSFIDWTDSQEIFGLLIEYVVDERLESWVDRQRHEFLSDLLTDLNGLNKHFATLSVIEAIAQLRNIYESVDPDFKNDPVILHVRDCIEELELLKRVSA